MGTLEDQEHIIKGCVEGDRRCQQRLYETFYGKMLAVCMRYAKDDDAALDVCQEGFMKVFEKLEGFGDKGSLEGWIRRIMVNTAIDHIRKDKKWVTSIEIEKVIADESDEFAEAEEDNGIWEGVTFEQLKQCMQHLTPAYRSVFNLYVVEEYSHKEIAEMLGISVGTSKSNLAKAKANMKKIILTELNIID